MSLYIQHQKSPRDNTVLLTVAEISLEPSSFSAEEGDMQIYLLGKKNTLPQRLHFERQAQLKVTRKAKEQRKKQFELELRHASVNF